MTVVCVFNRRADMVKVCEVMDSDELLPGGGGLKSEMGQDNHVPIDAQEKMGRLHK